MITCKFEDGNEGDLRHTVVHVLAEKDGKLLLEKRADDLLEGGKWSLPGGFIKRDESAQQAALRELYEETGWRGEVTELFRINSKPDRPHEDRQNIAFEFVVKVSTQDGQPDQESSQIKWVKIDEIIDLDQFAFDHGETIKLYLEHKKNSFKLPLLNPPLI